MTRRLVLSLLSVPLVAPGSACIVVSGYDFQNYRVIALHDASDANESPTIVADGDNGAESAAADDVVEPPPAVTDNSDGSPSAVFDSGGACIPLTCTSQGAECGRVTDGCDGVLDCGSCETGACGGGGPNRCGTKVCVPSTCTNLGAQCGQPSDGCGGTLSCGNCNAGRVCVANVCHRRDGG
jgi:hypothetical protein